LSAQINPYAPPSARVADVSGADTEAEAIRREHIKHEASVRSVGILYYIGGAFMSFAAIVLGAALAFTEEPPALTIVLAGVYLVMGPLSLAVGRGIRTLQPWARTACIVLSLIGLLGFPVGTLINGYILYLMLARKGRRLFEPDYPAIVAATPHIKYRTSIFVWIVLAIILLGVVAGFVIGLSNP
jgi:hypothetical protein